MKKLFLLLFLTGCSTTYVQDLHKPVSTFPQWDGVLKREAVVNGSKDPAYFDIIRVNREYNAFPYKNDVADEWSTPKEFVARGKGDCDEYAVAKYYALRENGFTPEQLNMVIFERAVTQSQHIVTVVKFENEEYVLDNEIPKPVLAKDYFKKVRIIMKLNENGIENETK